MSALPTVPPPLPVEGPTPAEALAPPPPPPPTSLPVDLLVVDPPSATPATKTALEGLLKARRLQAEAPPLRGETRATRPAHRPARHRRPAPRRVPSRADVRGARSRLVGPHRPSALGRGPGHPCGRARGVGGSGRPVRSGLRGRGRRRPRAPALAAGPARSEAEARALAEAMSALATLLGSGLFAVLVFDLAGFSERELRRLPATTWVRLQRAVAPTHSALVLIADAHVP